MDRVKGELEQLHQQRLNDWRQRNIDKEKLSKMTHHLRKARHAGSEVKEVKDVVSAAAANLHVTGSSLRADAAEGGARRGAELDLGHEGHRTMLTRSQQRLPGSHGTGRTVHGHVTASETVEALPENLLAATYPPRPRPPGHSIINTLQLPRIPHRTSST